MSNIDFFNFEEKIYDFPFYNKEYPLSRLGLISFIIAFFVPVIIMFIGNSLGRHFDLLLLVLGLIAVGIASHGDFTSICKRLKVSDISLIFKMIILQLVCAISITLIEVFVFHIHFNPNIINTSIIAYVELGIGLFGEELLKLMGLFIFAFILYKFTSNRKVSIGIAVFLSISIFGLMHYHVYGNIIHSLVAIGFASIFTFYTYLKTKNIFVSYITHLIYDFLFILINLFIHPIFVSNLLSLI